MIAVLSRALVILAVIAAISCGSRPDDATLTEGTSSPPPGLTSCKPGRDPDVAEVARKDRIAKGVYRASKRLKVDGDLEQWDTPYGQWWVVNGNFDTFSEILGEQAVRIYGDDVRGVHAGDVVLDCGAHFGGFTRTALNAGAKLVVAIEIAPENVEALRRNFAPEIAAGRVIVYDKGVWDKDDTLVLERKKHTWADKVEETGPGPTVAVTTIDKIVAELKLSTVNFIKMDIEGAERHALAGAAMTLKSYQPRMAIAAYHEPDDLQVLQPIVHGAQPAYSECLNGLGLGHGYLTFLFK